MDVRSVSSVETVVSSTETIPYAYEDGYVVRSASTASTITIDESSEDEGEDPTTLLTHYFIPDRPPAPFSEDVQEIDVESIASQSEVTEVVTPQLDVPVHNIYHNQSKL